MRSRRGVVAAVAGAGALALALGSAPLHAGAADHLDAPGLTSPAAMPAADINDVYAFPGRDDDDTVLAVTTHPALGAISPLDYASGVAYTLNIDRNRDAVQDLAYVLRFRPGNGTGVGQRFTVTRYTGKNAKTLKHGRVVGKGRTGRTTKLRDDAKVFVGARSDPFFFDLNAFLGAVVGNGNGRTFCDQPGGKGVDFFAPLNVNAIVLEVETDSVGSRFGVWAATSRNGVQIDRMGRPAINTVFNKGADKNRFNDGIPKNDFADFSANVITVLKDLGKYDTATATAIAHVLLPDILVYDTRRPVAGPLNGRALSDDVIDVELGLVTQGAVPTDCVGPHSDTAKRFPYLGAPHTS